MQRFVLGPDSSGLSSITEEGPPQAMFSFDPDQVDAAAAGAAPQRVEAFTRPPGRGGAFLAELFGVDTGGPTLQTDTTRSVSGWGVSPPAGGFRLRMAHMGPHAEASLHQTSTFDVDLVMSGEVTLLAANGDERLMRQGDFVVIPGVEHAWRAGDQGCAMAYLMFGLDQDTQG
jgi:quercetin dioxygenase-like cupin family protein